MAPRKKPTIPDEVLDQLLAGRDAKAAFHDAGFFDDLKKALTTEIICANSSQAKGRVERANKTLQDRLVKELRLAGVSTMEAGNAFLPTFMAD